MVDGGWILGLGGNEILVKFILQAKTTSTSFLKKSLGKKISKGERRATETHWERKCLVFSLKFFANPEGNNKSF